MNNLIIEENNTLAIGFINSTNELEYTVYTNLDSGVFRLDKNIKHDKEELLSVLKNKLKNSIEINKFTTRILGHNVRIVLMDGKLVSPEKLGDEVYEISQSILDGNDSGNVFVESKKEEASWRIVK